MIRQVLHVVMMGVMGINVVRTIVKYAFPLSKMTVMLFAVQKSGIVMESVVLKVGIVKMENAFVPVHVLKVPFVA